MSRRSATTQPNSNSPWRPTQEPDPAEPTMLFGKHRGKPLSQIPKGYLLYLAAWDELWPDTREQVMSELSRRGLPFGRFRGVPLEDVPASYLRWMVDNFDELLPPYGQLIDERLKLSAAA